MNGVFTRPEYGFRPTSLPRASQAKGKEARDCGDGPITRILSVSHLAEDHIVLRRLLERTCWEMREVYSCRQGLAAIADQDLDVVLCEASLPDGSWKELLEDFSRREDPPYLIVASRLADERLWAEVLNLGGYDVLVKPFDAEEVCRVVGSACGRHQEGRIRRATGRNATASRRA
jgi:DNA-binding response OmpR family regulator